MHFKKKAARALTQTDWLTRGLLSITKRPLFHHEDSASAPSPKAPALLIPICRQGLAQLAAHHHGKGVVDPFKDTLGVGKRTAIYIGTIDRAPHPWDAGETDSLPCCSWGNTEIEQTQENLLITLTQSNPSETRVTYRSLLMEKHCQKNLHWKEWYMFFSALFQEFSAAEHVMLPALDSLTATNALQRPWNFILIYGYFSLCFFLPHYKLDLN